MEPPASEQPRRVARYARIRENLFIGNYEAFEDLCVQLATGVDKPPLTDVTAVINLSRIRPSPKERPSPDLLIYIERLHTDDTPNDGSFATTIDSLKSIINISIKPCLDKGNTLMLVCESGRLQSAILAVMCQLTRGVDADKIYTDMVFVYMTKAQRERYIRIENEIMSHKFDDVKIDDPDAKYYTMDPKDKAFYEDMKQNYICMSPQYRKLLAFHLNPPTR